jgi:2-phosphoglycolate phosphatase
MTLAQPIRAVLFDLDGTLIDSAPDLGAAADKMRTDRALPSLPAELYRPMAGAGARGMLSIAFGITPEAENYDALREEFFANYEKRMTHLTYAFEGVASLLEALQSQGISWGIVTNKSKRFTEPLARQMPLLHGAKAVVSGDTTPHAKPHPAPLLEAAQRIGIEPAHCVYVGDDERDIIAGKAAGMQTVAACYGYLGAAGDVSAWNADASIDSPMQLLQLLAAG